jgi:CRP-like cAMP-binding protein
VVRRQRRTPARGPERKPADLPTVGPKQLDLLARTPLFSGLSRRNLKRIAEVTQVAHRSKGAMLVAAGAPGATSFYVIVEGTVDVVKNGETVNQLGPGSFFGELGVIDGGRRNASIVATSEVTALRMTRAAFKQVMTEEPGIAYRVMESLVARIRAAEPGTDEDAGGN